MTNQPENILSFPYQVRDDDTPVAEMSMDEAIWVARHEAAWLLNQLATGRISEIPEPCQQYIRTINAFCIENGYPPVDCDF